MTSVPLALAPDQVGDWHMPYRGTVAMICLIIAETALFTIFVVAYIYYLGHDQYGPTPKQVLKLPIFSTICLLSSSFFVWRAELAIAHARMREFRLWWGITIVLGLIFLVSTALEWQKLIFHDHLTVRTNLFGTTFYCLVGLHATHVIIGLLLLSLVWSFSIFNKLEKQHAERVKVLSLYWHFVDAIWVVVFTTVYVAGR